MKNVVIACSALLDCLFFFGVAAGAPIAACKGVPIATVTQAQQSAQAQGCAHAAAFVLGIEKANKKTIVADAREIFMNLQNQFNLPPFCAASIVAVIAQQLTDG